MPGICSQKGGESAKERGEKCVSRSGRENEREREREKHIKEQIVNISRFIWPIVK